MAGARDLNPRVLIILIVALGVAGVLVLRGCEDPERKLVEASLAAMVAAVEQDDRETLAEFVAVDYKDRLGHDDVSVVRRVMREVEHYPEVLITLEHLSIHIEDKSGYATARFLPELSGDIDEALKSAPKYDFQRGQRISLRLRKHGPIYKVVKADMGFSVSGAL